MKLCIFFTALLVAADLSAKTCQPMDVDRMYDMAEYVFEGVVNKRTPVKSSIDTCGVGLNNNPLCGPKIAEIQIIKVWKGKLNESPKLYSGDACLCLGSYLDLGQKYIVFAASTPSDKEYDLIAFDCGGARGSSKDLSEYLSSIRDQHEAALQQTNP